MLGALALLLLLALVSYHDHDRSFSDTGGPGPVGNWIGPVGAWVASFFLLLFGRPAYLFPVMLAYAGWLVHKDQALSDSRGRINTLLRAVGFVLTLLTSCVSPRCTGAGLDCRTAPAVYSVNSPAGAAPVA